jgi:hypothetical protein
MGMMSKEERASVVKRCFDRLIDYAIDQRKREAKIGKPPSVEWRTYDAIVSDLQMAQERAIRKALK